MENMKSPIEQITVKLRCESENATGFFVADDILLTAYHTFLDCQENAKIEVYIDGKCFEAIIIDTEEALDVVLLKVNYSLNSRLLPLEASALRVGENWETFGFPYKTENMGIRYVGITHQIISNSRWDYLLDSENIQSNYNYGGLSGSPIVISDKICAVTLVQQDNKLGVISIKKVEQFLLKNGIDVLQPFDDINIPEGLKEEIAGTMPNFGVFDQIDRVLHEQNGWVLLYGSPGSGKTTIAATYIPENESISVIGRYFLKVPQDTISSTVRNSKRKFIEWIEELVYRTIGEILPPQTNWEEKEKQIPSMIQMLSYYLESTGKTGVVIIDGLDELISQGQNTLFDFLGIILLTLPANLRIIISCTSKDILPTQIKEILDPEQEVYAEPLDLAQCENYIQQKTKKLNLPYVFIQELARKSEGHPLYLNYLINYLLNEYKASDDEEQIYAWMQTIPVIGGNITNYYNSIWDKISKNAEILAIIATLSQTRGLVKENDLIQMLEKTYQIAFYTHIKSLLYLFNYTENKEYEIYHTSFSRHIEDNLSIPIVSALHDNIIAFCIANENSKYTIWNYLFHLSKCTDKKKCMEQCSQNWADKCALNDVDPELVLIDIKNAINVAIDFEKTTDVIRLLLLSQRIEFRYDSVFAENAFELAEAMIALEKPEAAYSYLVRENTVLTTESDSIYFLQLFYENGYEEIAYKFYQNIDAKQRETLSSKEGILAEVFLTRLYAQTQLCHEGKIGIERFQSIMGTLGNLEKILEKEGKDAYAIRFVREYGAADNLAFSIRNYDQYVPVEQLLSHINLSVDKQNIKILALTLLKYEEINNEFNYIGKNDSFFEAINDITTCIQKHKFDYTKEELYLILLSLIADCKESAIITNLIDKYSPQYNKLNLRKENGVDVDFQTLFHYNNLNIFRGYLDENNSYPVFSNNANRTRQWESYLGNIIENISFIRGKTHRHNADNKNELDAIYNQLKSVLSKIDFTFDERSHWDRSYQIPEMIFPYIYAQIAQLYIDFFKNKISDFSNHLKNRSEDQLCLFTEGFRKSLFEIISLFVKYKVFRDETFDLLNILENHILKGVQNRWERTPELIKLVKLYALFENKDKAMNIFQKMLDTSMGPSWYKEDQLQLINRAAKLGNRLEGKQVRNYATILDLASGEMTFQRYVRYEKEEFIGALAKQGMIADAIEYFKFETLPSPNIIIQNAESNTIDMPRKGDGYILGARNIIEAHGVLNLLLNAESISPLVKWALSEIYFDNDDNFRYIDSFAKLHAEILNNIDPELCDPIIERLSSYLIDNISDERDRKEYLSNIQKNTSENIVKKLQGYLLKRNYSWGIKVENEINENNHETEYSDSFAEACDFYEKNFQTTSRDVVLQKTMNVFRENRVSVWFGNYSRKHSLLRDYLKEFFSTDHEALKVLRPEIINTDSVKWVVVSQLLWFLENKVGEHTKELQAIISDHFALLIRPEADSFKKYEWIELKTPDYSSDKKTIEFIIWLLNHPSDTVRERAKDVLLWLGKLNHTSTITSLIEESLSDKPISSAQECSFILKRISNNNPEHIHQAFLSDKAIVQQIIQIKHFTIFKNYFDISIHLLKIGYFELYTELKKQIPKAKIITGEVILDDAFLIPIKHEIEYFNDMQILNREFCEILKAKVLDCCNPLQPIDFAKSDRYLKRSFYDDTYYRGRYPELLNHALNHAIMCRVDEVNINEIYDYLN